MVTAAAEAQEEELLVAPARARLCTVRHFYSDQGA